MNYKFEKALMVLSWTAWFLFAMFAAWFCKVHMPCNPNVLEVFGLIIIVIAWMFCVPVFYDWHDSWECRREEQLKAAEVERVRQSKLIKVY